MVMLFDMFGMAVISTAVIAGAGLVDIVTGHQLFDRLMNRLAAK